MRKILITYEPIGVIHSGHVIAEETPIQPVYAKGCRGHKRLEVVCHKVRNFLKAIKKQAWQGSFLRFLRIRISFLFKII